jgi:hypothetical protein
VRDTVQYTSQHVVLGSSFSTVIVNSFTTVQTAAPLTSGKVRLTTDPSFNPTPGNVIADFTPHEAAFPGYPTGGIATTAGSAVNLSPTCKGYICPVTFTLSGSPGGPAITGYWIDNGLWVVTAERFAAGLVVPLANGGDFLELLIEIPLQEYQDTV